MKGEGGGGGQGKVFVGWGQQMGPALLILQRQEGTREPLPCSGGSRRGYRMGAAPSPAAGVGRGGGRPGPTSLPAQQPHTWRESAGRCPGPGSAQPRSCPERARTIRAQRAWMRMDALTRSPAPRTWG